MSPSMAGRSEQRKRFVQAHLGAAASKPVQASSDAGFRSYWRTHGDDGRSIIVMDSPPDLEDVRPWLHLHALLEAGGVRVPAVLARDTQAGFLLLEDLGGPTLLQTINPTNADAWFDLAREQLLRIQHIVPPDSLPHYNATLVRRELALFEEWFLGVHLGITLEPNERTALGQVFEQLTKAFVTDSQVLVHRDFMPRNLMPLRDGVAVLDFQDAVSGPLAYDVLSLFKDAFLSWPEARIAGWIEEYRRAAVDAGLNIAGAEAFRRTVDFIGVQRHLKVLGIFARLHHRDNKPRYLADAPRFIAYLTTVVSNYPELASLGTLLARRVTPRIAPMALP